MEINKSCVKNQWICFDTGLVLFLKIRHSSEGVLMFVIFPHILLQDRSYVSFKVSVICLKIKKAHFLPASKMNKQLYNFVFFISMAPCGILV